MFVLNFVISRKVTSLPKVFKYVKRSKYSFHDLSAKHTPSATLKIDEEKSIYNNGNSIKSCVMLLILNLLGGCK